MSDTSSYPKPEPHVPMLNKVKQWGELEQQQISISQAQVKQINDQFGIMNSELALLARGNPSKEEAAKRLTEIGKTFNLKPQVVNHMLGELNTAPNVKTFAERALMRGQDAQQRLNQIYGVPQQHSDGQTDTNYNISQMDGIRQTGQPIQRQIPPTAVTSDPETGQPRMQGPTPAVVPPGRVSVPTPLNNPPMPFAVQRGPAANVAPQAAPIAIQPKPDTGLTPDTVTPNDVVANRYPGPSGPATAPSPLFTQGLGEYTKDQAEAGAKAMAIKPLVQAIPLINSKGFMSGPGTELFTNAVAGLKTWGLIDTAIENDPTAIRQEVNKKLADYVRRSPLAGRSDAAQALSEASSPSAKVQIIPALKNLVRDAIALERIGIAMPNVFKDKDYSKYIKHKGTFPTSIDEKALTLDLEADGGSKIVLEMAEKEQSKNAKDRQEAAKFFKSLRLMKEAGIYN